MSKEKAWSVMLIAPVGTRDVTLTDLSLLPDEELRQAWNHADPAQRTGARQKGDILRADLERYAPALRLDILGKAVRHVFDKHGRIDRLLLVASNQPTDTLDHYRKNDTFELACLIKEFLRRDKPLQSVGQRTKIMPVSANPSSYEVMRHFYRQQFPGWTSKLAPDGLCYLEVTGGTAQMSTMLLLEGVSHLGSRAIPLYVMQEYDVPQTLDVGRQMLVDTLRKTLERDLDVYAYHAAWQLTTDEQALLRSSLRYYDALRAVLDATRQRLNLNLKAAQTALFGADQGLPAPLADQVLRLATQLGPEGRTIQWRIAEVYHSAVVRRRTEAFASFVGRLFRFQEAMLRYLCEQWGAQFGGKNEALLQDDWLQGRPDVSQALVQAKADPNKQVTRRTLQVVAHHLAQAANDQAGLDWLKRLNRFEPLAGLRNRSIIAHGFEGVSSERLAELYRGGVEQIEGDMEALLNDVLGLDVSINPYDAINELCKKLLEGER